MGIRYSLTSVYLLTGELWMWRSAFAFLRKDNILSWQMYKQSKQQGQASSMALETQEGRKRSRTWSMQEVFHYWTRCENYCQGHERSLSALLRQPVPYFHLISICVIISNKMSKDNLSYILFLVFVTDRDFLLKSIIIANKYSIHIKRIYHIHIKGNYFSPQVQAWEKTKHLLSNVFMKGDR